MDYSYVSPERALWLGVILKAAQDCKHLRHEKNISRLEKNDAYNFLFSKNREEDLESVCQAAGVEIGYIRRNIKALMESDYDLDFKINKGSRKIKRKLKNF